MKTNKLFAGILSFFKRNAYYVVLFICIAGIATMITLAALSGSNSVDIPDPNIIDNGNQKPPPDDNDAGAKPIMFYSPIDGYTLGEAYSGNNFVWYTPIGAFRTHTGVDLIAEEGSKVMAAYDGIVESVKYSPLDGYTVVIKHNEDLTTIYKSLSQDTKVKSGDRVSKGDVIGYVSTTMGQRTTEDAHLHFEVKYKGSFVDPMNYFETGDK